MRSDHKHVVFPDTDREPTCPYCGDGPEAVGTMYHIECVEQLQTRIAELEAELTALKGRRCETCKHAVGKTRWDTDVTFEKDGYAICDKVVFNDDAFWNEGGGVHTDAPTPAAWVVDGSDYWAGLHVTPGFACSLWTARAREGGE